MEPTNSDRNGPARASAAKRYGPIAVIVAIGVIIALVVALTGGDDKSKSDGSGDGSTVSTDKGWPFYTESNADSENWGPNCDTKLGTVKVPWTRAAPCAKQFSGDNGGATATGVTGDSIKVVVYLGDPAKNPLQAATVRGSGADVSPATARQVYDGYLKNLEKIYNFYGRTLDLVYFTGTGGPSDEIAARNDAKAIADMKPFAVLNGATQTPVWTESIAAAGMMCLGNCSLAVPQATVEANAPYLIGTGPTPEQAALLTSQFIIRQLKGKNAEFGGDAVKAEKRVFGVAHYNTVDNQQGPAFEVLRDALEKGGIEVAAEQEFTLDLARGQEQARTVISKMKSAGVTTVIFTGDPLTPGNMTTEATAQNYFPEWVIGPNVLVDIALFGRTYDQEQWQHAFGVALTGARVNEDANQSRALYEWLTGHDPENNTYGVIIADVAPLVSGIHLTGPNLTPENFTAALQRAPVNGGNPLYPRTSRGEHDLWPNFDWGGTDDFGVIWWNPTAEGEDEIGNEGVGLYEYVDGGKRYTYGNVPTEELGLFQEEGAVTIYTTVPKDFQPPSYPSPATK